MSLFPIFSPSLPASVTFTDSSVSTANLTTYTFASQSLGTAAANRKIVVAVHGAQGAQTVSTLTVAASSASFIVRATSNARTVELWQIELAAGTTGDVVVTWSGGQNCTGVGIWAVYGAALATTDTGTSTAAPMTDTVTVPSGGVVIAAASAVDADDTAFTWSAPMTERYDEPIEPGDDQTGADSTTSGNVTVTCATDEVALAQMMAVATWGPL